jgi:hypothetical protein
MNMVFRFLIGKNGVIVNLNLHLQKVSMTRLTMTQVAKSAKKQGRLARLKRLMVLNFAPEPLFDAITKPVSEVYGTLISLISLVDERRK